MNNNENGIVEMRLKKILKNMGLWPTILCLILGIPTISFAIFGIIYDAMHNVLDLGFYLPFAAIGIACIAASWFSIKKRIRLKKNPYIYVKPIGTSDSPEVIADKFNKEYEMTQHYPDMEKAGVIITENYVLLSCLDVEIGLRSSILCIAYDGKAIGKRSDNMTFFVFCRSIPDLKINNLYLQTFGKQALVVFHALEQLGVQMLNYSNNYNLFELYKTNYTQFEINCINKLGLNF